MEQEIKLFSKPDELIQWIQESDLPFDISVEDAELHFFDFTEHQNAYEELKVDEMRLDRLFDMTRFGREMEALAVKLANELIENLNHYKDLDTAVRVISKEVQQHSTGNRGR